MFLSQDHQREQDKT